MLISHPYPSIRCAQHPHRAVAPGANPLEHDLRMWCLVNACAAKLSTLRIATHRPCNARSRRVANA